MPREPLNEVLLQINSVELQVKDCRKRTNRYPLQEGLTAYSLLELALSEQGVEELRIDRSQPGRPRVRLDGHEDDDTGPAWELHLNGVQVHDDHERPLRPGDTVLWLHSHDPRLPEG